MQCAHIVYFTESMYVCEYVLFSFENYLRVLSSSFAVFHYYNFHAIVLFSLCSALPFSGSLAAFLLSS